MAIVWVLLHQCVVVCGETPFQRVAHWPANYGWYGVTLFFVLSGYLITGVLLDTRDAPRRVSAFYARRALRILPLYLLVVGAVFALSALRGGALGVGELSAAQAASFWLLLGNWSQSAANDFLVGPLAPTWSVAIEEQFYLAWPWFVWWSRPATLARVCCLGVGGCLLARCLALASGAGDVTLYTATWARFDALLVGATAALAARGDAKILDATLWRVLLFAGGAAALGDLASALLSPGDRYFCSGFSLGPGITLGALAAGALVLLLADHHRAPGLRRLFEAPWLRSFGLYSYGIYLTHGPVRAAVRDHLFGPATATTRPLVRFPAEPAGELAALAAYTAVCVGLCWCVGWLSYRLVERPMLRLKAHFPAGETPRCLRSP